MALESLRRAFVGPSMGSISNAPTILIDGKWRFNAWSSLRAKARAASTRAGDKVG